MRVKFFAFRVSWKGKGLLGSSPEVENGGDIEAAINEWLAGQPGIRISAVQQAVSGVQGIGSQFLYVTVWYETGA